MLIHRHRHIAAAAAALLLLFYNAPVVSASTITTTPKPTPSSSTHAAAATETCEFRTINYITDSLPQQCLRSSWSHSNGTTVTAAGVGGDTTAIIEGSGGDGTTASSTESASGDGGQEAVQSTVAGESVSPDATSRPSPSASEAAEAAATDLETGELNEASFLSFEDWKKQTLDKAGQANANIGNKKTGEGRKKDYEGIQNNFDSLGEEGEIDIDFGVFRSGGKGEEPAENSESGEEEVAEETQDLERNGRKKDNYRSKDAGKTCKERFSYASFDAGATILKTHPGAKNAKAVLIENKDSYMLSECSAENKFIIIELSEDIWIDTLVLANFEFFSSMIRTFRVSVSDRYPVKIEKWKDIGTYEARNSREIQAFLIENPQIWARYIRIEFLSHFGNEYYCPLSLVRVHGTRMLESWKETEANDDVDESDGGEEQFVPDAVADVVQEEERVKAAQVVSSENAEPTVTATGPSEDDSTDQIACSWAGHYAYIPSLMSFDPQNDVCLQSEAPPIHNDSVKISSESVPSSTTSSQPSSPPADPVTVNDSTSSGGATSQTEEPSMSETSTVKDSPSTDSSTAVVSDPISENSTSSTASYGSTSSKPQNATSSTKTKTSSTSSGSTPHPTIQESFFKSVSRRLQLLEANSTLSLKYIEEQSRILREAFTKVEKKQLQKTTTFLDTLNSTVLNELRGFRQQYDEIWQSTVISLESQRDESRREILAITTRLNILADEVIFQKRMSIVQSVLLLLCLGLVIFSRVSGGGNIDFQTLNLRARAVSGFPMESPLDVSPPVSPKFRRDGSSVDARWLETGHVRQQSDDMTLSRDESRENSPPTPISTYSRSEEVALTPSSGADDLHISNGDISLNAELQDTAAGEMSLKSSPSKKRTPRKRKKSIRQASPVPIGADDSSASMVSPPFQVMEPQDLVERPWVTDHHHDHLSSPPRIQYPSPPPEDESPQHDPDTNSNTHTNMSEAPPSSRARNSSFSIARKPLPALPPEP